MSQTQLIAVTGANGFIGAHIVDQLLTAGKATRAIVRSERSAATLKSIYAKALADGLLQIAYVPDITAEDKPVYREAFEGATGVIHVASPIFELGKAPKDQEAEFLHPAINGALNALKGARDSPTVKKVVMTSSVVASKRENPQGGLLSREEIEHVDYNEAKTLTNAQLLYRASKALSEKAAWDFVQREKPNFHFTTLLPALLAGPFIGGEDISKGSNSVFLQMAKTPDKFVGTTAADVRDVAAAHIAALETASTNGKRLYVVERIIFANEVVQLARKHVPSFPASATDGPEPQRGTYPEVDGSIDEKALGLTFRKTDQTIIDLLSAVAA